MLLHRHWGFARCDSISGIPQGSGNQCACAVVPHPADAQFLELARTMKHFNMCYFEVFRVEFYHVISSTAGFVKALSFQKSNGIFLLAKILDFVINNSFVNEWHSGQCCPSQLQGSWLELELLPVWSFACPPHVCFGFDQLLPCVNEWVTVCACGPVMGWCRIQTVFQPRAQRSKDSLRIRHEPNLDKVATENEGMVLPIINR